MILPEMPDEISGPQQPDQLGEPHQPRTGTRSLGHRDDTRGEVKGHWARDHLMLVMPPTLPKPHQRELPFDGVRDCH